MLVANKNNPKTIFTYFIQLPGLGNIFTKLGESIISKYGIDKPTPIKKNIINISRYDAANANETAVTKNGAVHGVASKVANAPVKKLPSGVELPAESSVLLSLPESFCGRTTSNQPN